MTADPFNIRRLVFDTDRGRVRVLKVTVDLDPAPRKREVEISVSPTGRSVRIWVDGKEIR